MEIPGRMAMGVRRRTGHGAGRGDLDRDGHPFAPGSGHGGGGRTRSTWADFGMSWDNSGKNGHYAPIDWSNA